jgi:hypothetical protein
MLDPAIAAQLTNDDPALWDVATNAILADAALTGREAKDDVFVQIGSCRHWIRPHQSRWIADGGFAAPFGYDKTTISYSFRALPDFEWSVFFKWTRSGWEPGRTGAHCLLRRIAIPARTTRHLQAAVHTIWTPRSPSTKEKVVQLFGFRKKEGIFATRDELIAYWESGWQRLFDALVGLSADDLGKAVTIRGEPHSVPLAMQRSLARCGYPVGQIVLIARILAGDDWTTITIPRGASANFNQRVWGKGHYQSVTPEKE